MSETPPLCIEMEPPPDLRDEASKGAAEANLRKISSSEGSYTRHWRRATLRIR
jgi:hypothetical protein